MFNRNAFQFGRAILASILMSAAGSAAVAADPPAGAAAPTKEMREQMAVVHEKMAACLRSDKPVADCHSEMMKSCQALGAGHGCGMRMHRHGPMSNPPPPTAS